MICYRDRQWCGKSMPHAGAERCVNTDCSRCVTDEDVRRATKHELGFDVAPLKHEGCGYKVGAPLPSDDGGKG